ncbi:hypothetical protein HU200_012048 [Digitaria exilis]|uniref:PARP-type domain-containing protein n=1 Tax=Digitaria exilis TaxID=1010633 RepID=A0A835KQ25_9POAL|nr:hypothetical protein HU200_012048 [Digitaria exilis]
MLVIPFSSLSLARNPIRLRILLPASAARLARLAMSTSPQVAVTVSVEYAKSSRSTCKGCSGAIASGALRLGASARDPRGFDATKWYHAACFPCSSHPLGPVESIKGFDSIKVRAFGERSHAVLISLRVVYGLVHKTTVIPLEESSPKKVKTSMSSAVEGVSDEASLSVEYAKSGRSVCKGCNENIVKGALRVGSSFHDPRGFDQTKWYHVECFPASSYPVFVVENLKGFDIIKDDDRQKLHELEEAHSMGGSKEDTDKNVVEVKKRISGKTAVDDEPSPKKVKAYESSPAKGVSVKASISVEYAKSGRSICKGCNENIAKGVPRLGASAHDPRGFDSTKWYHVACFPASSYPIFPLENLKGFDSIENNDREKLRDLEVQSPGDSKHGAENDLGEVKLPAGNNITDPLVPFSVSDIKKTYKKDDLKLNVQQDGLHASAKVAAFDFDGCLAKTSVRSIGADKWSLQHKSIPEKLQSLYDDGYKLVIFTNESNIERWKNKRQEAVDSKVGRLDNFIECVKVPIQVFIACGLGKGKATPDDPYRKPNPGMWWLMAQHFNSGIKIDMDQSFYVGDAAGRENDHSDADIEFAKAIGLKFYVPEEYFGH